jgi:hypothetical protein
MPPHPPAAVQQNRGLQPLRAPQLALKTIDGTASSIPSVQRPVLGDKIDSRPYGCGLGKGEIAGAACGLVESEVGTSDAGALAAVWAPAPG